MKTLHPVITIADELPAYSKEKGKAVEREATRPSGSTPEPVQCARCFSPLTKCEWLSCPQEWLQATGAICSRCGSEQRKEGSESKDIFWTSGSRLEPVLKFQHMLFSALQVIRSNYGKKPKLILGPEGAGRTSLLHAVVADITSNKSKPWGDELVLYFGNPNQDYTKEYDINFKDAGLCKALPFMGYSEVLTACSYYSATNITVVIDAETVILKPDDLSTNMAWEKPLRDLLTGFHHVNLILALKTSDSFTKESSPFYMGKDDVVDQFNALKDVLDPRPLVIFL